MSSLPHPHDHWYDEYDEYDDDHDDDPELPPMPCVAYDFLAPLGRFIPDGATAERLASWLGCWYEQCAETGELPPVTFLDDTVERLVAESGSANDDTTRCAAIDVVALLAEYMDMVARSRSTSGSTRTTSSTRSTNTRSPIGRARSTSSTSDRWVEGRTTPPGRSQR